MIIVLVASVVLVIYQNNSLIGTICLMGFGTHTEKKLDCNPRQQGQSMTDDENTNNRHKKQRMMVGKHRKSQWVALTVKAQ